MKTNLLLWTVGSSLLAAHAHADVLAIRVGRAETVSKGVIEHAVIFVEDGKIVTIGEDLPVDRGIPVLDRPEWTVIPGLVNCYSRMGCDSDGGDDMSPELKAVDEIWPKSQELQEIVKYGVTTLGLYPAGNGIPGQAVAIRPRGDTVEEMVLRDSVYLKVILRADPPSKKRVTDGFKKADEYDEKVKKAREKFDKDKDKKGAKKDDKKEEKPAEEKKALDVPSETAFAAAAAEDEKKDDAKKDDGFVPPDPDPKSKPFVDLRQKRMPALVTLTSAADYAHWLDALGKEDIHWALRCQVRGDSDLFYVTRKKDYDLEFDGIGDAKVRVVMEPNLTLVPGTMRSRNLALDFSNAGAKIVFIPRFDSMNDHRQWLGNVGEMVNAGLKRDLALRAVTLEPAELMGVESMVGSLDKGKHANMVFLNGDPFEPTTRIQAVMLDGKFVFGEVNQ